MGTAFPVSASAGRYFFSSAAVNDRSSDRRCVMSRASARSRSEPLASSTPRASSFEQSPLIGRRPAPHAGLSACIPCPQPYRLNAAPVFKNAQPCRLNAARPRKVSTRFSLERNSEGRRLRLAASQHNKRYPNNYPTKHAADDGYEGPHALFVPCEKFVAELIVWSLRFHSAGKYVRSQPKQGSYTKMSAEVSAQRGLDQGVPDVGFGGRALYDPPQLARFVVGRPPGLGQQCLVVGLGTAAENELRLIVRLVVHGTEPRHRDDDIAVLHHDGNVVRRPQGERPLCPQSDLSVSLLTNGQG